MPRKLRIQYPGAIYHVMSRGDQRERIFKDQKDRVMFVSALGEACQKTEWQVHAFCQRGTMSPTCWPENGNRKSASVPGQSMIMSRFTGQSPG